MVRIFAVVNNGTGELEAGCSHCGLKTFNHMTDEDFNKYPVSENHVMVEITYKELLNFRVKNALVLRSGMEVEIDKDEPILVTDIPVGVRKREMGIDTRMLDIIDSRIPMSRRPKVDDYREVDGVGGKELELIGQKTQQIIFHKNELARRMQSISS